MLNQLRWFNRSSVQELKSSKSLNVVVDFWSALMGVKPHCLWGHRAPLFMRKNIIIQN